MKTLLTLAVLLMAAALSQGRAAEGDTKNWDQHCAKCHGKDGKGATTMGKRLHVRDLTDPKVQDTFSDEQAFKSIKEGVTAHGKKEMPGFADKLSDADIKALVAQVRAFKGK